MANKETSIITGVVRLSYVHIFEKYAFEDGEPKYSVCLLIPKKDKDTIKKIKAAISAAINESLSSFGAKDEAAARKLKKFWIPLRDGDEEKEDDPNYEGFYFVNASTKTRRPGIVDAKLKPILDSEEVYSGCWGRADINFYGFSVSGNKGIACGLNNVQKIKDDEPLAGGRTAEDAFNDGYESDDDDDDMYD